MEQERLEHEKLEQEKLEQERLEQERLEQERLEHEKLEQEKLEQEKLEQEKLEKYGSGFYNKLINMQKKLKLDYGSFSEKIPEQMIITRYLQGTEKVLEIGGNIGRNSLIISSILNQSNNNNFVSLECDTEISIQLTHNRNQNNLDFFIENSALSKRKLIQKGWDTIVSDELLEGYKDVNIISWEELKNKYNINFNTLVLDCEGAFYYILQDMPEILDNINLICMENDYHDILKKEYIDDILIKNKFFVDYKESGGWGPYYNNFFEVWRKNII